MPGKKEKRITIEGEGFDVPQIHNKDLLKKVKRVYKKQKRTMTEKMKEQTESTIKLFDAIEENSDTIMRQEIEFQHTIQEHPYRRELHTQLNEYLPTYELNNRILTDEEYYARFNTAGEYDANGN